MYISNDSQPLCVKLHLRQTNKRTKRNGQTPGIEFGDFALKCDIWWQYLNDFPDNQLTKICVFIGWSRIFIPPPNFYEASRFVPLIRWTHLSDTTEKRRNGRVSLSVCLLDGVWHFYTVRHVFIWWLVWRSGNDVGRINKVKLGLRQAS